MPKKVTFYRKWPPTCLPKWVKTEPKSNGRGMAFSTLDRLRPKMAPSRLPDLIFHDFGASETFFFMIFGVLLVWFSDIVLHLSCFFTYFCHMISSTNAESEHKGAAVCRRQASSIINTVMKPLGWISDTYESTSQSTPRAIQIVASYKWVLHGFHPYKAKGSVEEA